MRRRELLGALGAGAVGALCGGVSLRAQNFGFHALFGGLNIYDLDDDRSRVLMAQTDTHVPELSVPRLFLKSGSLAPDATLTVCGTEICVYRLAGKELLFPGSDLGFSRPVKFDNDGKGNGDEPRDHDWRDLGWMPRIKDLHPGARLLDEKDLRASAALATMIALHDGELAGVGPTPAMAGLWQFTNGRGQKKYDRGRALSGLARFDTWRGSPILPITVRNLRTGQEVGVINISAAQYHGAVCFIHHVRPVKMMECEPAEGVLDRSTAAQHFAHHYALFRPGTLPKDDADRWKPDFLADAKAIAPSRADFRDQFARRINGSEACPPLVVSS